MHLPLAVTSGRGVMFAALPVSLASFTLMCVTCYVKEGMKLVTQTSRVDARTGNGSE